ncbi:response regulator [Caballeronia calidae]|uniref:Response regulator n=1 Tax=Caballeronia calidae TaxID=1777139 RepID=A0A158D3G5_9BURK|nr:response regulator transcription factor [Caballeronia calidae]SAK89109.1 response regulator [Caballeronia calidae]
MSGSHINVAIVDDHPLVVCGLRKTLEDAGVKVVGAASGSAEFLELLDHSSCDVVVADYSMPVDGTPDGWRFLSSISLKARKLPVLVYSEADDPFLAGCLATRGVAGIASKGDDVAEVLRAVKRIAQGGRYFSPAVRNALARFDADPEMNRFATLTNRQMEVAGLMLCGMSVGESARLLKRGKSAISALRLKACHQLGYLRISEMFRFAASRGLSLNPSNAAPECGVLEAAR